MGSTQNRREYVPQIRKAARVAVFIFLLLLTPSALVRGDLNDTVTLQGNNAIWAQQCLRGGGPCCFQTGRVVDPATGVTESSSYRCITAVLGQATDAAGKLTLVVSLGGESSSSNANAATQQQQIQQLQSQITAIDTQVNQWNYFFSNPYWDLYADPAKMSRYQSDPQYKAFVDSYIQNTLQQGQQAVRQLQTNRAALSSQLQNVASSSAGGRTFNYTVPGSYSGGAPPPGSGLPAPGANIPPPSGTTANGGGTATGGGGSAGGSNCGGRMSLLGQCAGQ